MEDKKDENVIIQYKYRIFFTAGITHTFIRPKITYEDVCNNNTIIVNVTK